MARRKKFSVVPVLMLAGGIAAGWWLATQGLQRPAPERPEEPVAKTESRGAVDIRTIDFRNHRYAPDCLRGDDGKQQTVQTRDGVFERNNEQDKIHFAVAGVSHGDLTDDGHDEAVVLTTCNTGGSGVLDQGFVYGARDDQVVELGRIETGSNAFGGIVSLRINKGRVTVERYATDEDGAHCCPKYIDTTYLRWDGARLVSDGNVSRRKVTAE